MPFRPVKSRPGQPFTAARLAVLASASIFTLSSLHAADTEIDVNAGATDLTSAASYTPSTAPTAANDVTFAAGTVYATPAGFTINSNVAFGSLNDLNATALTISNTGGAAVTLTLGGTGDVVTGSATGDLLYVASGGNLTINGGTGNTALGIALATNGNFNIAGTANVSSIISGAFAITKTGNGSLTLGGANVFSGGVTGTAGTIVLGSSSALGSGTFTGSGMTLNLNGQTLANALASGGNGLVFTNSSATPASVTSGFNQAGTNGVTISDFTVNGTGDINWSGAIRRTNFVGTVTKAGTNTLTLSGAGTDYTNMAYSVTGGTFALNLTTGSTFNSGTITVSSGANVGGAETTGVTNTIGVTIAGAGSFTQSGAGTTILSVGNTYTGTTTINTGGTLQLGNGAGTGTLSPTSAIVDNGAFIINRTGTVTQGTDFGTAAITGTGSLTKNSGGTVVFNAANTYSGGTTVLGGTVQLGSSSVGTPGTVGSNGALTSGPLGTSGVYFNNGGAVLDLNGQTFGNRFTNVQTGLTIGNTSNSTATVSGALDGSLPSTNTGTTGTNVISDFSFGGNNGDINWTGKLSRTNNSFGLTKIGSDTVNFTGTTPNTGVGTLTVSAGTVGLGMTGNAATFGDSATVTGGTLKFRPDLGLASGGNPWAGQLNGALTLNSGTVDLFGSSGQNSRQQQFLGTGGTLTNTSATAGVLGISARNNTAYTFAGTIQDGAGTVGIDFSNQGTASSGRINLFSGTNTYSGTTTISFGTYELGNALASQNSTLIVNAANGLGTNGTYALTTTNPLAFASGIGAFTIGGLSGAGNIALTDIGRTATGATATATTVTLQVGSSLAANAAPAAYTGVISDGTVAGGTVTKIGSSTEIFSGANTYTGVTTINGGVLSVGVLAAGGTASGIGQSTNAAANLVINGGALTYTGPAQTTDRNFTIGTAGATINASGSGTLTLTGAASFATANVAETLTLGGTNTSGNFYSTGLVDNGTGALSLVKNNAGRWDVSGINTYTGGTTINGGTLRINNSTTSLGTGNVTINAGGTLDLSANAPLLTNLSGAGTITTNNFSGANVNATNSVNTTFSGSINNGAGTRLTKSGSGTLTLSGTSSYAGTTTVNAGSLLVNGSITGTGNVTVASGSTLGGGGSLAGTATLNGTVAPGTAASTVGMLTLTSASGATIGASGIYLVDIGGTTSDNLRLSTGALTLTSGATLTFNVTSALTATSYNLANYTSETGSFAVTNLPGGYALSYGATELDLVSTAVPEPSTWAAGLLCLGALGYRMRRRLVGLFTGRQTV